MPEMMSTAALIRSSRSSGASKGRWRLKAVTVSLRKFQDNTNGCVVATVAPFANRNPPFGPMPISSNAKVGQLPLTPLNLGVTLPDSQRVPSPPCPAPSNLIASTARSSKLSTFMSTIGSSRESAATKPPGPIENSMPTQPVSLPGARNLPRSMRPPSATPTNCPWSSETRASSISQAKPCRFRDSGAPGVRSKTPLGPSRLMEIFCP